MFRSKSYPMMLAFVFLLTPFLLYAQPLSLENAVQIALQKNEKIMQYSEKAQQKRYGDYEAWGNFLPSVSFNGALNHLNEPMQIDLNPIRSAMIQLQSGNQVEFANIYRLLQANPQLTPQERAALFAQYSSHLDSVIPPFVETFKKQDYRTATLVGVQPLFMGGKLIAAKRFAKAERNAAGFELQKTRNEVVRDVVNQYLSIVLLSEVVKTREEVLAGMNRHQKDAQSLFKEGLISKSQVLRAEVAVADAERNLFDDRNRLSLAQIALRQTLSLEDNETLIVEDSLVFHAVSDSMNQLLETAYSHQPILQMIGQKKTAANQKYASDRSEMLPTLAAFGKYELYPEYLSSLEPRWVIGLQLNYKLFTGLQRYYRLQSAKHLKNEVGYLDASTRREIRLWIEKSYRSMSNARERYQLLRASLDLAQENLRQNEVRFQTGLASSLDVIDAQLALEKQLIERLTSLFEYYTSWNELYLASGEPDRIVQVWKGMEKTQ